MIVMADIPVKKRWKIDFSSKCSKNVVSFVKPSETKETKDVKEEEEGEELKTGDGGESSPVQELLENKLLPSTKEHNDDQNNELIREDSQDEPTAIIAPQIHKLEIPECSPKGQPMDTSGKFTVTSPSQSGLKMKILRIQPIKSEDDASSGLGKDDKASPRKNTKKKKVMITIQTYNSEEEEEPVKVRPQRRSKPSLMDLRDQHRVFNATSFMKEKQPLDGEEADNLEPRYEMAPSAASTAAPDASPPLISVALNQPDPTFSRIVTSSSDDTEDGLPLSQYVPKKQPVEKVVEDKVLKKVKKKKLKKKKKDPQEPQKPVSAYALFFRDMQASIKTENPEASFGEISKIVANQWDALDDSKKANYKKKTETAKKDYLKKLAAYKANLISSEGQSELAPPEPQPVQANPQPGFVPAAPLTGPHLYEGSQRPEPPVLFTALNAPTEYESGPHIPAPASILPSKPGICVNDGCTNLAIEDSRWDREYCSTECVVQHCRDAFQSWVLHRQDCGADTSLASVTF